MKLARRMLAAGLMGRKQAAPVAPVASAVSITGTPEVGATLTGSYTYSDADGSAEGTSTFRWLRDGVAIGGAVAATYLLDAADEGASITFEVTPVSVSAPTTGTPVVSSAVGPVVAPLLVDDCEVAWTGVTGLFSLIAAVPTAAGTGYVAGDLLSIVGGGGTGAVTKVQTVDGGGAVLDVSDGTRPYSGGYGGYSTGAGLATTGGSGTGCTVNITGIVNTTAVLDTTDFQTGAASVRITQSGTMAARSLVAFHGFSSKDLSSAGKLRVRYKNATSIVANQWRLRLCSDAFGRVPVDDFWIPATPGAGAWIEVDITRSGGGAMGANINSIALWTGEDLTGLSHAAKDYRFDDIRAVP